MINWDNTKDGFGPVECLLKSQKWQVGGIISKKSGGGGAGFLLLLHAILVLRPTHLAESDSGRLPVFPCT